LLLLLKDTFRARRVVPVHAVGLKDEIKVKRPLFNNMYWLLGVKIDPWKECSLLHSPSGVNTLFSLDERRGELGE
jgi:hypothetical protein